MSAFPVLGGHAGHHRTPARHQLAARISGFLRAFRPSPPEGGRAAPAPPQGAARTYQRPDGVITVDHDGSVTVRPVNGRLLGTQPRQTLPARTRRPGKQPWLTAQMPALYEPEPDGPSRAWDPGAGTGPPVPLARPYAPPARTFYGCCEHCEGQDHPPAYHGLPCSDGCNETPGGTQ